MSEARLVTNKTGYDYLSLQVRERRARRNGIVIDFETFQRASQEYFAKQVEAVGGKVWHKWDRQIVYFDRTKRKFMVRAFVPDPTDPQQVWTPVPEGHLLP